MSKPIVHSIDVRSIDDLAKMAELYQEKISRLVSVSVSAKNDNFLLFYFFVARL